jgi:PAS domain-containing protein
MIDRTPTEILPRVNWLDPRAHPLGDTWLLTIFTILLAIGLPRLASGLEIDFAVCALGLLALALIHVGFAVMAARVAARPKVRTRVLTALHALGVVTVGFIWQHAGGLQNPALLAAFVLPVIGAVFVSRWQPYATAALSVVTVMVLTSGQAPGRPFPAFYAPAGYSAVLLEVFAVTVFGCAVAVEYLRTVFDRLHAQVSMARGEAMRSQKLWSELLQELPLPAALIDADTQEILSASAMALSIWSAPGGAIVGRGFFEVLQFSYPEAIETLINGQGGVEPLCIVRAGEQLLATEVRVQHLAENGRRLALVTVSDATEALCVKAALDAAEHAALVVDASGRVLVVNRPARAVFPEAQAGVQISQLVPEASDQAAWWDPGLSRCKRISLTVMRRVYRVTTTAVALPGEEARLYVVAFMPASAVAGADRGATTLTAVVRQL